MLGWGQGGGGHSDSPINSCVRSGREPRVAENSKEKRLWTFNENQAASESLIHRKDSENEGSTFFLSFELCISILVSIWGSMFIK